MEEYAKWVAVRPELVVVISEERVIQIDGQVT